MSKKSVRENKNRYQEYRESEGLTRAEAAEQLDFINESRLERIEYGALPHPEEVVEMARVYKRPELCRFYCANECRIGKDRFPEITIASLQEIVLELLHSIHVFDQHKDRLIEIAVDGKISPEEAADFEAIRSYLDKAALTVEALKLWFEKSLLEQEEPRT